jgi:hypothetical protein
MRVITLRPYKTFVGDGQCSAQRCADLPQVLALVWIKFRRRIGVDHGTNAVNSDSLRPVTSS